MIRRTSTTKKGKKINKLVKEKKKKKIDYIYVRF